MALSQDADAHTYLDCLDNHIVKVYMTFTAGKLREDHPAAASEGSTGGMAESQLHVT